MVRETRREIVMRVGFILASVFLLFVVALAVSSSVVVAGANAVGSVDRSVGMYICCPSL